MRALAFGLALFCAGPAAAQKVVDRVQIECEPDSATEAERRGQGVPPRPWEPTALNGFCR